jgi:two-component system chemotaxis response regulator CheB
LRSLLAAQADLEVVGEAKNGLEATRLVSKLKPSVILMDIGMPVMDGIEATQMIMKNHPTVAAVRAITAGLIELSEEPDE